MPLFSLTFYLYIRMIPILKMAEEIFGCYDAQSDTKRQKLLECILTGNCKLYLGKAYTTVVSGGKLTRETTGVWTPDINILKMADSRPKGR